MKHGGNIFVSYRGTTRDTLIALCFCRVSADEPSKSSFTDIRKINGEITGLRSDQRVPRYLKDKGGECGIKVVGTKWPIIRHKNCGWGSHGHFHSEDPKEILRYLKGFL